MFEEWFVHVGPLGWFGFLGVTREMIEWANDLVDVPAAGSMCIGMRYRHRHGRLLRTCRAPSGGTFVTPNEKEYRHVHASVRDMPSAMADVHVQHVSPLGWFGILSVTQEMTEWPNNLVDALPHM